MKDTKSIVILIFSLLIGVQQWEHRESRRRSKELFTQAIDELKKSQEGWRHCIEMLKLSNDLGEGKLLKGTREKNGITYYLSSDGEWHVNRVVGEFYLNDKTQTWEEFKP